MSNIQNVQCSCGTWVQLQKGMFGWKTAVCPRCSKKVTMEGRKVQVIRCEYCNNEVAYDITKPAECPLCHKPFERIKVQQRKVPCPKCGVTVFFDPDATSTACHACNHAFDPLAEFRRAEALRNDEDTIVHCTAEGSEWVICKVPRGNFPVSARVMPQAGAHAFVVAGSLVHEVVSPMALTDVPGLTGADSTVDCSVYYVSEQLGTRVIWGAGGLSASDGMDVFSVSYSGSGQLKITDAKRFLQWMNFAPCSRADIDTPNMELDTPKGKVLQPMPTERAKMVRTLISDCFQQALDTTRARFSTYPVRELASHSGDVLSVLTETANGVLWEIGLQMSGAALNGEMRVTAQNRTAHVECELDWRTSEIYVRDRDNVALYANLVLGGGGHIRVKDASRFIASTDGKRFTALDADEKLPANELSERVGRMATNQFQALLPTVMGDVNPPLTELPAFFQYCCSQLEELLNAPGGMMDSIGLRVEHVTIAQKLFKASPALEASLSNMDTMAVMAKQEELRRYTQTIEIAQTDDGATLAVKKIEAQSRVDDAKSAAENKIIQNRYQQDLAGLDHQVRQQGYQAQLARGQIDISRLQDTYHREKTLNEQKDAVDAATYAGQAQLQLTAAAQELEERIKQADNLRELELLRIQNEKEERIARLEKEKRDKAAEVEMLKLQLEHMARVQGDKAAQERFHAEAERARAEAEREYARTHDLKEQERFEKQQEQVNQMLEQAIQARIAMLQAQSVSPASPQVVQQPVYTPVYQPQPYGNPYQQPQAGYPGAYRSAAQPGVASKKRCPNCQGEVDNYTTVCPHCNQLL